jgi:hypothetical protein
MDDFDLDRSVAEAWDGFTERLGEVLAVMDPGATLSVGSIATEGSGTSPYVRFRCEDDRTLVAGASGNADLAEEFQLSPERLQLLADLGWDPPGLDGGNRTSGHLATASQEDSAGLAARAVQVLREVFGVPHPAFLAPDQLAEVLAPASPRELPRADYLDSDLVAVVPGSAAALQQLVRAELGQALGHEPLTSSDGDLAARFGSAMVFVRCTPDAQEVIVFSPLVHELEGRSRAMEVLSDLNTQARYLRFLLIRDRVYASMSVLAQPFVPAHLHQALAVVSRVADDLDHLLATKLRGRTTFSDESG